MAFKLGSTNAGNIINTAIAIYRSDFRGNLSLAIAGALWSIIPIYGWARSSTILAVISTRAYNKLTLKEESISDVVKRLRTKIWGFWFLNILGNLYIGLILFITFFTVFYIFNPVNQLIGSLGISVTNTVGFYLFIILLYLSGLTAFSSILIWFYGKVSFAELPLAIEPRRSALSSMIRAWQLSNGSGRKIQIVFTIGSAVISSIWFGVPALIGTIVTGIFGGFWIIYFIGYVFVTGLLQIVKAVVYYDLLCKQEGIDIDFNFPPQT